MATTKLFSHARNAHKPLKPMIRPATAVRIRNLSATPGSKSSETLDSPPQDSGTIQINFAARAPRLGSRTGLGGFSASARNWKGELIGVTYGRKKCETRLEIQTHSMNEGVNLAKKLMEMGIPVKKVTLASHHAAALGKIRGGLGRSTVVGDIDEDDDQEEVDDDYMDVSGDEDDDGREWCVSLVGDEVHSGALSQEDIDMLERDKMVIGQSAAKGSRAPATEDIQDASSVGVNAN